MASLRSHLGLSGPLALLLGVAAPAAALARPARPPTVGRCPEGYFAGFVAGTDQYVSGRRMCTAIAVDRLGRAQDDRLTCIEAPPLPVARAAPTARLAAHITQDRGARSWTVLSLHLGHRRLLTWRSYFPLLCAGSIYVSPDRYIVAVELLRSQEYQPTGEHVSEVVAFRLPRPLPGAP